MCRVYCTLNAAHLVKKEYGDLNDFLAIFSYFPFFSYFSHMCRVNRTLNAAHLRKKEYGDLSKKTEIFYSQSGTFWVAVARKKHVFSTFFSYFSHMCRVYCTLRPAHLMEKEYGDLNKKTWIFLRLTPHLLGRRGS